MTFGQYVKLFRQRFELTQEALVEKLYVFDDVYFGGLDATTLSKWERDVTRPKAAKQSRFLKFAQHHSGEALPIFSEMPYDRLEEEICHTGLHGILKGKMHELVLDMHTRIINTGTLRVLPVSDSPQRSTLFEIAADLRNISHPPLTRIQPEKLEQWHRYALNYFRIVNYKDVTTGLLFSLRLKPEAYRALMLFERSLESIDERDFAAADEEACYYSFVYFALNEISAIVGLQYFFLEMIYRQRHIRRVGATVARKDAHTIVRRLQHAPVETYNEKRFEVTSYDTSIETLLSSEYLAKAVFVPTVCEEE
jgi:transcriptional regulator with XRE-family HTH domain